MAPPFRATSCPRSSISSRAGSKAPPSRRVSCPMAARVKVEGYSKVRAPTQLSYQMRGHGPLASHATPLAAAPVSISGDRSRRSQAADSRTASRPKGPTFLPLVAVKPPSAAAAHAIRASAANQGSSWLRRQWKHSAASQPGSTRTVASSESNRDATSAASHSGSRFTRCSSCALRNGSRAADVKRRVVNQHNCMAGWLAGWPAG